MSALEGRDAHLQALTVVAQLSLSMWKGLQPMLEASAVTAVNEIDARNIQLCTIPAPRPEHPDDGLDSHNYTLLAKSYEKADPKKAEQILSVAPTAILGLVCRLQASFKGLCGPDKLHLNVCGNGTRR